MLTVLVMVAFKVLDAQSREERREEAAPAWSHFARLHELSCNELNLWGSFKGYPLKVDTEDHRLTRVTVTHTRLFFAIPALPRGVVLMPGGGYDGLPVLPEDATPELTAMLRNRRVRECFSAAANAYRDLVLKNGQLSAQRNGRVPVTVEELEAFIEPAFQLARAFDEAARSSATPNRPR
ncbi:hypothetical protein [Pyxidicoccus xibeiensis]|uniref:hypothetical protein n=1 Tax=Pyxidicoccus xibeiensis TaxID=2906759 RepID=UPI0020A7835C|nr:hypothetical protein [Pyxidicoccus xibeiensis]